MLQDFPDEEQVRNVISILEGNRTQEFKLVYNHTK